MAFKRQWCDVITQSLTRSHCRPQHRSNTFAVLTCSPSSPRVSGRIRRIWLKTIYIAYTHTHCGHTDPNKYCVANSFPVCAKDMATILLCYCAHVGCFFLETLAYNANESMWTMWLQVQVRRPMATARSLGFFFGGCPPVRQKQERSDCPLGVTPTQSTAQIRPSVPACWRT